MAFDPDFQTIANTKLYIVAARPVTDDAAAWGALTFVQLQGITSVPSVLGREYNNATLATVDNPRNREKKASYTFPPQEWGFQWTPEDAGQVIALAASKDYTIPGFKVVRQNGDILYFSAQVSTFMDTGGSSDDALVGTMTLLKQSEAIIVPVTP